MSTLRVLFLILMLFTLGSCNQTNSETPQAEPASISGPEREFYQLKVYTFDTEEQVDATDNYLENAFLPGLKKLNIDDVGVFRLKPGETDSTKKTFVLIPFSSLDQFLTLEARLEQDEAYLAAGSAYLQAPHDQAPYQRIESTLMKAFTDMPAMQTPKLEGPRAQRIYELRNYESATERLYQNKVDMFNAGGEIKLFDRLEFNAVFYAEVISGAQMPNLMYMTTFEDQASRDAHWEAFFSSPEWEGLKAMEKYKNNVSHADILFLYPTAYSDY